MFHQGVNRSTSNTQTSKKQPDIYASYEYSRLQLKRLLNKNQKFQSLMSFPVTVALETFFEGPTQFRTNQFDISNA